MSRPKCFANAGSRRIQEDGKVLGSRDLLGKYPRPPFGRLLLPFFCMDDRIINLNAASYGALPRSVLKRLIQLLKQAEADVCTF